MKRFAGVAAVIALAFGLPGFAAAQGPAALTDDQKGYIAYDRCMMQAAIKASYTEVKDEEIFGLAKSACAPTRVAVTKGLEANRDYLAALDAADADKASNFPAWIKSVRARRKERDAVTTPAGK